MSAAKGESSIRKHRGTGKHNAGLQRDRVRKGIARMGQRKHSR